MRVLKPLLALFLGLIPGVACGQLLQVNGTRIVNSLNNQEVILNAVNFGNWMVMEGYLMNSTSQAPAQHDWKSNLTTSNYTAGNEGWSYRNNGVDVQPCADALSNGYNVGWFIAPEWMRYTVTVATPGTYRIELRVAKGGGDDGILEIQDGDGLRVFASATIPDAGGFALRASNGKYLRLNTTDSKLYVDAANIGTDERFHLKNLSGTRSLQGPNGLYVSSEDGSTDGLSCTRSYPAGWEYFREAVVSMTWVPAAAAPAAPQGLEAAVTGQAATLNWSPVSGASHYTVKRATLAGGPYSMVGTYLTEPEFTDHFAQKGLSYYYTVVAYSGNVFGPASEEVSLTALPSSTSSWNSFQNTWFSAGQLANTNLSAPDADPNHDGLANVFVYTSGISPWLQATTKVVPLDDIREQVTLRDSVPTDGVDQRFIRLWGTFLP